MSLSRVALFALAVALALAVGASAQEPGVTPTPATAEAAAEAAPAPGTRAAEWIERRLARRERLSPAQPGFFERTVLAIEKGERPRLFETNWHGLYPRVQSIATGSKPAAGVRLWQPDIGASAFDIHASAFHSLRGFRFYDLQVGRLPHHGDSFPARSTRGDDVYELGTYHHHFGGNLVAYLNLRFQHLAEVGFSGLGNDHARRVEASFLQEDALYEAVVGYQWSPRLTARLRYGSLRTSLGRRDDQPYPGDLQGDLGAPGVVAQPDVARLSAQVFLDRRDEPGNPHRGATLALEWARHDARGGSLFDFTRLAADARGFVPLGSRQRVLALRGLVSADRPATGARVPFFLQETLGGSHSLRGYDTYRFRGEKLLLLQAEYRIEASPVVEFALFVDAGKAVRSGEPLDLEQLRSSFGAGLRFKTFDRLLARLDAAFGREGARVMFRTSAAF